MTFSLDFPEHCHTHRLPPFPKFKIESHAVGNANGLLQLRCRLTALKLRDEHNAHIANFCQLGLRIPEPFPAIPYRLSELFGIADSHGAPILFEYRDRDNTAALSKNYRDRNN